jgi:hypothetical protein
VTRGGPKPLVAAFRSLFDREAHVIGWILRAVAAGVLFLVFHGLQAVLGLGLPWWGSLAAAVATYAVLAFGTKALFLRAVTAPFEAKGAALRGARLVVHAVEAIAAPVRAPRPALAMAGGGGEEDECDDTCDDTPPAWRWYRVDATVTPPALTDGPFRGWAPGELGIVSRDADTSPKAPSDDGTASIKGVEVFEDGAFVNDEGMSFEGEKRLRLTIACAPELQVAKLRYYFEGFGIIDLPRG